MRQARDVDDLIAAEWSLEELALAPRQEEPLTPAPPTAEELEAKARREREAAEAARKAELDAAVKAAHDEGFEQGRRMGEEGEAARLRNAVAGAEAALEELREGEMRWTGSIEENICALAVAIARQVIGRELREDADTVVDLVRRAMSEFPIDQPIRIRIHPMDLSAIESTNPRDGSSLEVTRDRDARWIADPRITPGGCVVEGRERIVDGRVDTALERIYKRLTYHHG